MRNIIALLLLILSNISTLQAQTSPFDPWNKSELYDTKLAKLLTDTDPKNDLVIFNIGPVSTIKGAKDLGAASKDEGLDNLKKQLKSIPKNKTVIVYCGCCPFNKCPNIRPAFSLLKKEGYSQAFILDLPHNINQDWISKGYPVDKE